MRRSRAPQTQVALWALGLLTLSVASCDVDERALLARGSAGAAAGSVGNAGSNGGGEAGEVESDAGSGNGTGDAGAAPAGGSASGNAGSPSTAGASSAGNGNTNGGTAGSDAAGGGSVVTAGSGTAGSGVAGSGVAGSGVAGNSTSSGGSAGSAGAPGNFPCGDIDHNGVDDCTDSSIVNAGFDLDTNHWKAGLLLDPIVWDSHDGNSKSGSGSLLIANVAPTDSAAGSIMAGAEQCLQVTGDLQYSIGARVFVPGGQGAGEAGVNLWIFGNDGCTGTFLTSNTLGTTNVADTWVSVQGQLKMPTAARSLVVRLVAVKPFAQAKLSALFDDVLVKQMP